MCLSCSYVSPKMVGLPFPALPLAVVKSAGQPFGDTCMYLFYCRAFLGLICLCGHAVAVKELRKEVTQYRSLKQLKDELAVVQAPPTASAGVES